MERTCRCGKPEEPKCEAWWGARALNAPPICRGNQWLDYEAEVVYRECQFCAFEILDPYDHIGERSVMCSTCYEARYGRNRKKKNKLPGNDLPAICRCAEFFLAHGGLGWQIFQCDVHICTPADLPPTASVKQGRLL